MSKHLLGVRWACVTICILACAARAADEPSASDEVVLRFPPERSMGWLSIVGDPPTRNRTEAQGDVRLPRGKKFGLLLSRGTTDLSCLHDMPKQGLEALSCNMLDWTDDAVAQVTALEGLKTLYLSAPNVTDDTLAAVARMSSLNDLSISAKSVTNEGLRKLAPLNLRRLSLYGIKISDECVATIAQFKELESLSLRNYSSNKDNVGDAGVAHLTDLTKLESLDLEGTKVTDVGMASLAGLVYLKSLTLSQTAVTNDGLKHLAGMRGLTTLNIDTSGVSDAGLVHIAHLAQLEGLKLGVISSDAAFEQLGKLTSLKRLEAHVGNTSDAAWSCVDNLVGLESLRLMGPGVDDVAMTHIARLSALKSLNIQNSRVTDEGLSQMARLSNLEHFSLYRSPITADGLRSLSTLKRLTWLSLGGITDMGTAGLESLALSPSIETMNLGNDFHVATITEDEVGRLAALPKLRFLQLSSIEVTDRGAKVLSQFPALAELSMDGGHCSLTDEGLASLAKTVHLTTLSTGGVFTKQGLDALARAKSLKHVILSTNDLPPEAVEEFRKNCYLMVFPYKPQPMITAKTRAEQYFIADSDPHARITQALTDARLGHARVVLAIGSAKSEPGQQLATLLASDVGCQEHLSGYRDVGLKVDSPAVSAMLAQNYGLNVMIDAPTLVILEETDAVVAKESFAPSESGGKVDATAVREFLKKHAPVPLDAQQVLADALSQARAENKRVYVQESGMHCAPCLAMSRFIDLNREILAGDFVFIKIDRGRYAHADEAMEHIRSGRSGGIPWVAILDAEGKVLATSNGPDGQNLGFPYDSISVEHYLKMLSSTAQRMTGEQLGELRRWFEERRTMGQAKTKESAATK
jgi:internalin A